MSTEVYVIAGLLGALALYAMTTETKAAEPSAIAAAGSVINQYYQSKTTTPVNQSQSKTAAPVNQSQSKTAAPVNQSQSKTTAPADPSQSKATADSAPVVTGDTAYDYAVADESKQDGGSPPDETPPPSDDSPAASMGTVPDTQPALMAGKPGYGDATSKSMKAAATDAFYGKPRVPDAPGPSRVNPAPMADKADESRAEGGDSKSRDFVGKSY